MNFVGKILVVLIMVMSFVFMAFAISVYATHKNWREEIVGKGNTPGWKKRLEEAQAEYTKIKADRDNKVLELAAIKVAKAEQLAKLESQNKALLAASATAEASAKAALSSNEQAAAAVSAAQKNLENAIGMVNTWRTSVTQAQSQEIKAFDKAVALADRFHQAAGELALVKEQNKSLAAEVSRLRLPPENRPPVVPGEVRDVRNDFIEISLGSDDGVKVGHFFEVFRDTKYLGRVEVMRTDSDQSVAKFVEGYKQGTVTRGDRVIASKP